MVCGVYVRFQYFESFFKILPPSLKLFEPDNSAKNTSSKTVRKNVNNFARLASPLCGSQIEKERTWNVAHNAIAHCTVHA